MGAELSTLPSGNGHQSHNMDFPSSPSVGPSKRSFDDELQESPTANRAKRARPNRKDRFPVVKKLDGNIEQDDLASENTSSTARGIARKETPIYPPIPFTLNGSPKLHVSKSDKAQNSELKKTKRKKERKRELKKEFEGLDNGEPEDDEVKKNEAKATENAGNGVGHPAAMEYPKAQANTRKTRAEARSKSKHRISSDTSGTPTVAGPSTIKASKTPVYKSKELTPLSDIAPIRDYTFKSYPNPVPAIKQSKSPKHSKENNDTVKSPPSTDMDIEMDRDTKPSPATPSALANPSGTKTLKSINKQLRALSAHFASNPQATTTTTTPTPATSTSTPNNTNSNTKANSNTTPLHPAYNHEQQQQQQQNQQQTTAATLQELTSLRSDIARLHQRLDRDGLRAAARHTMLFNALVKVAGDVGALQCCAVHSRDEYREGEVGIDGRDGEGNGNTNTNANTNANTNTNANASSGSGGGGGATPRASSAAAARETREKLSRSMLQSRKTLERCLASYTGDMDRAGTSEEVLRYGGLAVQYAGDLFKTLG